MLEGVTGKELIPSYKIVCWFKMILVILLDGDWKFRRSVYSIKYKYKLMGMDFYILHLKFKLVILEVLR